MDRHAFSLQSAQLTRTRNHDDERFSINIRHPRRAPEWTFVHQETPANTDFSGPETPGAPHTSVLSDNDNNNNNNNNNNNDNDNNGDETGSPSRT